MRITIDGFDETIINHKQTSTDEFGTIRRYYRFLSKFAVVTMKVLADDSSINYPPDRDLTCEREMTPRQSKRVGA